MRLPSEHNYKAPVGWLETYTGRIVDVTAPDTKTIDLLDIAHGLSMQCRFNGHVRTFYSVAEHCVLVARALREWGYDNRIQLLGLLHDAAETYVGDIIRGVKSMLPYMRVLEGKMQTAIMLALNVEPADEAEHRLVKDADNALLVIEATELMPGKALARCVRDGFTWKECSVHVRCWTPKQAQSAWLDAYTELC